MKDLLILLHSEIFLTSSFFRCYREESDGLFKRKESTYLRVTWVSYSYYRSVLGSRVLRYLPLRGRGSGNKLSHSPRGWTHCQGNVRRNGKLRFGRKSRQVTTWKTLLWRPEISSCELHMCASEKGSHFVWLGEIDNLLSIWLDIKSQLGVLGPSSNGRLSIGKRTGSLPRGIRDCLQTEKQMQ